mgnify:CR=1 FL=1
MIKKASINEFNSAKELDEWIISEIKREYFMGTFVYSIIAIAISAVLVAVTILLAVYEVPVITTLMVIISGVAAVWLTPVLIFRCIMGLIIYFKIKSHVFVWRTGFIDGYDAVRVKLTRRSFNYFYLIDDEYYSSIIASPLYRKGTEVYVLYYPYAHFLEFFKSESVAVKIKG